MRVADKILKYLLETDTVSDKERWQVYSLDIANALGVKEAKIVRGIDFLKERNLVYKQQGNAANICSVSIKDKDRITFIHKC